MRCCSHHARACTGEKGSAIRFDDLDKAVANFLLGTRVAEKALSQLQKNGKNALEPAKQEVSR